MFKNCNFFGSFIAFLFLYPHTLQRFCLKNEAENNEFLKGNLVNSKIQLWIQKFWLHINVGESGSVKLQKENIHIMFPNIQKTWKSLDANNKLLINLAQQFNKSKNKFSKTCNKRYKIKWKHSNKHEKI